MEADLKCIPDAMDSPSIRRQPEPTWRENASQ
jgi:hypothetical protein